MPTLLLLVSGGAEIRNPGGEYFSLLLKHFESNKGRIFYFERKGIENVWTGHPLSLEIKTGRNRHKTFTLAKIYRGNEFNQL